MNHLSDITDEQRKQNLELAKQAREAKKEAAHHLKTEYSDMNYWKTLASKYNVRLPVYYQPFAETKYLKRAAKMLGVDIQEYVESCGCKTLKEYASLNITWTAQASVGLFLEWWDDKHPV
ncbi:MAG: hypothetical protein ACREAU_10765 [Nitrosopumilaceae archaeon]